MEVLILFSAGSVFSYCGMLCVNDIPSLLLIELLVLHQFLYVLFAGVDLVYCKEIICGLGIQMLITFIPMFPNNSFVVEALCFQLFT